MVGVAGGAVRRVVAERRLGADRVAVPVSDLSTAPAVACGERDAHLRVDVAECADVAALTNLHAGKHRHPRGGLCRRSRQCECGDRGGHRCEHAQPSSAHYGLRSSGVTAVQGTGELRTAIPETTPHCTRNCSSDHDAATLHTRLLAEAPRGKPSRWWTPVKQ